MNLTLFNIVNNEAIKTNNLLKAKKLPLYENKTFFHKLSDNIPLKLPTLKINNSPIQRENAIAQILRNNELFMKI